ncbi:MAG: prepilin peptidase [Candidatus Pacebacteria bacterium]|jgi:prepilin signal peptidase PulO-like enzyme (type II secretory pathway)|nr:prepilin peptidase [Candidatus Paceibacterota bacterium]
MEFLALALVFVFGTIIGSFLNVVIYRYNSGTSPLTGRSHCFSCGKVLTPRDLVPIFSFLVARGRCAKCGVRLSWQYPLVEALTGLMFVSIFLLNKTPLETTLLLGIFSTLIVIGVYDLRHQIIPDGLVAIFAILGLLKFFLSVDIARAFAFPHAWTLIAGPMLFFPFWFLWFISQGRWLGLGDGKLALGIGWFLGATLGGSAVILAFWIGAAYALIAMGAQKVSALLHKKVAHKLSMQSEIPFGPFLIVGVVIVFFMGINLFDGSFNLFAFL